jgi:hypothetical protein
MTSPAPSSRLLALMGGRGKVLVLTGAGVSSESGIATFRDAGGVWEGIDPMRVATPRAFASDPEFVWRFYDARARRPRGPSRTRRTGRSRRSRRPGDPSCSQPKTSTGCTSAREAAASSASTEAFGR